MKLLLTAFEPFGGGSVNAAWEAVQRVCPPDGILLVKRQVPTVFGVCINEVEDAIRSEQPDAVICVGQAAGRAAITPERVAINVMDARIPDNAGFQPVDEPIVPDGPAAYFSTLPIKAMRDAILANDIPAAVSDSAGTFVCNDLFYGVRHLAATEFPAMRCGFLHVPCTPEQAAAHTPSLASLPLDTIVKGLEIALSVFL